MKVLLSLSAALFFVLCGSVALSADDSVTKDIVYDDHHPDACRGDLYRPGSVAADTPVVVLIHGGGWGEGDRYSISGIARFLQENGFAVFNVEYRLSGAAAWPACGEDCVRACEFVLSRSFASRFGMSPKRIIAMGASAGGHLALWAGLSLGPRVSKVVSISGIADPHRTVHLHRGMYKGLLHGEASPDRLETINPTALLRSDSPEILCTHALDDEVVAFASAEAFVASCREKGVKCRLYAYDSKTAPTTGGHCIWRVGSNPHRLTDHLEREILWFLRGNSKVRYVPEPKPVKTGIEVHAFYYPGTEQRQEWDMVEETLPEVKPLLGWYDEGNPEVVDWQIKWAVEHGISAFCVDWYWHKGVQRLNHWVKAYYRARYSKYLKWYVMYANHNDPGSHTTADTKRLVRYWLDNFFHTPQYYTIDGKPVVMIWDASNFGRDFAAEAAAKGEVITKEEGLKRALSVIEDACRAEGIPGVHFLGRHSSEHDGTMKSAGYGGVLDYGYDYEAWADAPEARKPGDTAKRFDYSLIRPAINRLWREKCADPTFLHWPLIPTGWDDRPRSYQTPRCVITGRTPEKFRKVLEDCKAFCRKHGHRRVIIAPLNEWQEGSYVEPNEEYGFGMYDAIRDVFAEKPAEGWPKNVTPEDLGLGPYDYPEVCRVSRTRWDFTHDVEGWYRLPYGTASIRVEDGCLRFFRSFGPYAAIRTDIQPVEAKDFSRLAFRAKMNARAKELLPVEARDSKARGLVRWGMEGKPLVVSTGKDGDVRVRMEPCAEFTPIGDNVWHEYEIDLSVSPEWKGRITEFWLDPHSIMFTDVSIDWIELRK